MSAAPDARPRFAGPHSLLLLAIAAAYHFAPFAWPVNRFDGGIVVVAAQRILRGELPYVDFQTLYTPGHPYLTAAAFRVFGVLYDMASRLDFALMALQAWLAWHVAARLAGSRFVALLAFAAGLAFSYPYPSLSVAFVALMMADRALRLGGWGRAALAGALAGIAAWFRQDVGFAAALAVSVVLWTGTSGASSVRLARAAVAGGAAALALALLLAPAIVLAPSHLWDGLVANPAATVPFRNAQGGLAAVFEQEWFFGAVAVFALAGGVLGIARAIGHPGPKNALLAGLAVLALWELRYLCLRPETHHLVPAGLLVGILGVTALPRWCLLRLTAFAVCAAAIAAPLARSAAARAAQALGRRSASLATLGDTLPGSSTLFLPASDAETYRRLVTRLRELVPSGGAFLSACERHDRIHDQDLLLYFAADRRAVPFDWHFDPGITTREDVQRGIVADCERAGVGVVVRYAGPAHDALPAAPGGSQVLDEWIAASFRSAETFGRYEVMVRR